MISGSASLSAETENAAPARQAVEGFIQSVRSMEFPVTDASAHAGKVTAAHAHLDMEAIGSTALGAHWQSAAEEQKKQFAELLPELIANIAYPRSRRFLASHPIEYHDPKPAPENGVEVETVVKNEEKGLDAPIVYRLHESGGAWKVYDILLDGVPLTEDLKYQFDRIIAENSFDGLIERMRARLAEAKKENLPPAA